MRPTPKRILQLALGITLSAVGFVAAVYAESAPWQATPAPAPVTITSEVETTRVQLAGPGHSGTVGAHKQPAPVVLAAATPVAVTPSVAVTPQPQVLEEPAWPVVPDLKGDRLSIARRKAATLDLRVKAIDEWGERVMPSQARFYRVRDQKTQPDSELEPRGWIEVRVREIAAAVGY